MGDWPSDRLARALAQGAEYAWGSLPPEARRSYRSLAEAMAELSPGAAIRDTLDASGRMAKAAWNGDGWGAAGAGAGMLTAAAGLVPGGRAIGKGARELPETLYHVAGPSYRAGNDIKPPINFMSRQDAQNAFRAKWPEGDASHIEKVFFHDDLAKAQDHVRDFGGSIYQVDPRQVRDLHIDEIEPEWATRYLVPWRALTPVGRP